MLSTRRTLLAAVMAIGTLIPNLAAAADRPPRRPVGGGEVWVRTELYFGTSKPDGQQVTEGEFNEFVATHVTPRFPDGLTLLTGYGQFRGASGEIVREKSFVLILFYPPQMQDANAKVQQIREKYKYDFRQESVLRVDGYSLISF